LRERLYTNLVELPVVLHSYIWLLALPANVKLGGGEYTSLLYRDINYHCKRFYITGPKKQFIGRGFMHKFYL
jgi:hypothetical protein